MATQPEYRHQDIAVPPAGTKVRTIHAGKHLLRIAFPKGARKRGSGQIVSILHPRTEKNPACGGVLSLAAVDVAKLDIPIESLDNGFGDGFEDALEGSSVQNPTDWRAHWEKFKAKLSEIMGGTRDTGNGTRGTKKRNYTEQVTDSQGRKLFVDVVQSGKRWMAQGFPVSGGKVKRVGRAVVAYGDSEAGAYDALTDKLERNPKGKSKGKTQKSKGKSKGAANASTVNFYLKDYLKPGGTRAYASLSPDLEDALRSGNKVYLYSVPGFMMLSGQPGSPKPWHSVSDDKFYKTARQALALKKNARYSGDPRWITAKYGGTCARCKRPIARGEEIYYYPTTRTVLCSGENCGKEAQRDFASHAFDENPTDSVARAIKKAQKLGGKHFLWTDGAKVHIEGTDAAVPKGKGYYIVEGSRVTLIDRISGHRYTIHNPAPASVQEIAGSKYTFSTSYTDRMNVRYELYKRFPGQDGGAIIVRDLDANQVIHIRTYPTFKKARYEYGRTIKIARKNPEKGKRNLDEIRQAASLAAEFKGSRAENVREINIPTKQRDDYAHLGWLDQVVFHPTFDTEALLDLREVSDQYNRLYQKSSDSEKTWREVARDQGAVLLVFDLTGDEIELAASADGKQLFFLGGKQAGFEKMLDDFKTDTNRDEIDLGEMVSVTYTAQKKQAGDTEPRGYYHIFGEDGGQAPRGRYDMLNKRIFLVGGTYHLKEAAAGIIN